MTQLEYTLGECLSDCGLRELPPEWDSKKTTLVDGIALVVKSTGNEYCKVANKDGKIAVVRDYGKCVSILKIERIYAINTITKADIPKFKSNEEIIHFLCKSKYDRAEIEELLKTDRAEVKRRIRDLALEMEKHKISERKRVDEIKEFAQKAKEEKQKTKTDGRRKKKD